MRVSNVGFGVIFGTIMGVCCMLAELAYYAVHAVVAVHPQKGFGCVGRLCTKLLARRRGRSYGRSLFVLVRNTRARIPDS